MSIEGSIEDLAYEAAFWMEGLGEPHLPLDQMGETTVEVCERLRALAIAMLLTRGDSDAFLHNLVRSGRARLAFLERAGRESGLNDHNAGIGRIDPMLDALAAGDVDLVRRIARASRREFVRGMEYEDDYCLGVIIGSLAEDHPDGKSMDCFMERYLAHLEELPDGRWLTCDAVIRRDLVAFETGFIKLLDERDATIEEDVERSQIENAIIMTQRFVFVEGLAMLRLAEWRGIPAAGDYRMCPSVARVPMKKPFPGD